MTLAVVKSEVISTNSNGVEGDDGSYSPIFSPDGTKVVFSSTSTNLVSGDTNGTTDVFIKDLTTGVITRVNTGAAGQQAIGEVYFHALPVFSPDSTKIMFQSRASNLVPGDTNGIDDIFIKDLITGAIIRVNTSANGDQAVGAQGDLYSADFSPDGTKIVFSSSSLNLGGGNSGIDIFLKDLLTGEISVVSTNLAGIPGDGHSFDPEFSPDGTKIIFYSFATNLVPSGDANSWYDVFVKDLVTGEVTLVNTDSVGNQPSNDAAYYGQFLSDGKVAFLSGAALVPEDTNQTTDVYIKDLITGIVTLASKDSNGNVINGYTNEYAFSPNGIYMAMVTDAALSPDDLDISRDLYLKNLITGELTFLYDHGSDPQFSADGTKLVINDGLQGDIVVLTLASLVVGTNGADILTGTSSNEVLYGLEGDDILNGQGGLDTLIGGAGNDWIYGHNGEDHIWGGEGSDTIFAGASNDQIEGGTGDDVILSGAGNDIIKGQEGKDAIAGEDGDDYIEGGTEDDTLYGGNGADWLEGGDGNDIATGGIDNDVLLGQEGNDALAGEEGDDSLAGGNGDDILAGGLGADALYGEAGADIFYFGADALNSIDHIYDFVVADGDKINISDLLVGYDPLADAITDFVSFSVSSGNTQMFVDRDGSGAGTYSSQQIALLYGVGTAPNAETLETNGNLITV